MDESGLLSDERLRQVRAEFSLSALAYNLKRVIAIVGVPGLIAALA